MAEAPKPTETPEQEAEVNELHPVSSSMVDEVGYDEEELQVVFTNGKSYSYPMDRASYLELLRAPSIGKFLWEAGIL